MRPSSAKQKGRLAQQHVARRILETFSLPESDVKSLPMGSQGADIWMSGAAQLLFPFAVEVKKQEKLNVHEAFNQAIEHWKNSDEYGPLLYPLLVHSRNRSEVLATLRFDDLLNLLGPHAVKRP